MLCLAPQLAINFVYYVCVYCWLIKFVVVVVVVVVLIFSDIV